MNKKRSYQQYCATSTCTQNVFVLGPFPTREHITHGQFPDICCMCELVYSWHYSELIFLIFSAARLWKRLQRDSFTHSDNSELPVNLTSMPLHYGRKPRISLLWGNSADHSTAVPPKTLLYHAILCSLEQVLSSALRSWLIPSTVYFTFCSLCLTSE